MEITPQEPISMGGFGQRSQKPSQGVHDSLFAKALYLDNGSTSLLLITTDPICVPTHLAAQVVAVLAHVIKMGSFVLPKSMVT